MRQLSKDALRTWRQIVGHWTYVESGGLVGYAVAPGRLCCDHGDERGDISASWLTCRTARFAQPCSGTLREQADQAGARMRHRALSALSHIRCSADWELKGQIVGHLPASLV